MKESLDATLRIINQLYELEKKISRLEEAPKFRRNLKRITAAFEELGFSVHIPMGEKIDETRTDCEVSIAGNSTENLVITDVIKPVVHFSDEGVKQIVQRGVVIAEELDS